MNNIELTPIFLLLITALVKFLDFVGNKLYDYIKSKKVFTKKVDNMQYLQKLRDIDIQEKKIYELEEKRLTTNNTSILQTKKRTDAIIDEILDKTLADRFVIFNTHNGNGQPNYYKPYKVSHVQFDTTNKATLNNIRKYDELYVDNEYTKMLLNIQNNPEHKVRIVVSEMPNGLLKAIYKKEKIKYSEVYFICSTPTGIIYTSIASLEDIKDFGEGEYDIDLAISQLKSIFIDEKNRVLKDEILKKNNMDKLQELQKEKTKILDIIST
jgi:hypothetical protein